MLTFLDFDGVIVDSIEECYLISKKAYFGHARFPFPEFEYKELFYKYRGLVRPPYEYMFLHKAIELHMQNKNHKVRKLFEDMISKGPNKDSLFFEKEFFFIRGLYKSDNFDNWVSINPLTKFGKTLVGNENPNLNIITTKNREATESLLDYYNIPVSAIYANDEIKSFGNKGKLIKALMDEKNAQKSFFLDDAVEHLDTVKDDRVRCFFADWGYGKNSSYEVYKY
jgi:phosphoglycolate phosphatase-like HAD superfamily hydrolase